MASKNKDKSVGNSGWRSELARDFLSLGSWVFFVLVVARILILPYRWPYLTHLLIAAGLILVVDIFARKSVDGYLARSVVLAYYLCLFYENRQFSIFVTLAVIGLLISSRHLGNDWKKIIYGVVLGLVGVGVRFIL